MRIIIFYFSGTGNTYWAAHKISERFNEYGDTGIIASIEAILRAQDADPAERLKQILKGADLMVLGHPTHGSYVPEIVLDFIKILPDVKEFRGDDTIDNPTLDVFTFCTQWMFSGDGAYFYHDILESKGYMVRWAAHFKMPSNFSLKKHPKGKREGKLTKRKDKTAKKIEKLVDYIKNGREYIQGRRGLGPFFGALQRNGYIKERETFKSMIKLDADKCIKCYLCISICPNKCISMIDGEVVRNEKNCLLCLRCVDYCPKNAYYFLKEPYSETDKLYGGPIKNFNPVILTKELDEF